MIVKIYLPERLYRRKVECELYGEVTIEDKSISYFIISDKKNCPRLRLLGYVRAAQHPGDFKFSIEFSYYQTDPTIFLSNLNVKLSEKLNINLFLYDEQKFRYIEDANLEQDDEVSSAVCDVNLLRTLLKRDQRVTKCKLEKYGDNFITLLVHLFQLFACIIPRVGFIRRIGSKTTLYEHSTSWKKYVMQKDFHSGHIWTILLDIFAGILVIIGFLYLEDPSKYFIRFSNTIILQLRSLLNSLKGSPVGLKLNVQLNNFFLDCFVYHIDLWATFLVLVSPLFQYLFVPVVILGFFGLSFQLALLADIIVFISLHAQCFYIYAAVLYHIELLGFQTLWKVVLGKRRNVLKGRVESHDYMNRQLFLTTLFFTVLLFLFPTVIVYYVVFAFLRTCIFFATYTLMLIRRKILVFPIRSIIFWMMGRHLNISNIDVNFIGAAHSPLQPIYAFNLKVKKSSLSESVYCWKMAHFDEYLSINQFLLGLCKGKMMGFTLPKVIAN